MTQTEWLSYLTSYFRGKLRFCDDAVRRKRLKKIVRECERHEQQWKNRHQLRLMLVGKEKGNVRKV